MPGDDARPDPRTLLQDELDRRQRNGRARAQAAEHAQRMAEAKAEYERVLEKAPSRKWPFGARKKPPGPEELEEAPPEE